MRFFVREVIFSTFFRKPYFLSIRAQFTALKLKFYIIKLWTEKEIYEARGGNTFHGNTSQLIFDKNHTYFLIRVLSVIDGTVFCEPNQRCFFLSVK